MRNSDSLNNRDEQFKMMLDRYVRALNGDGVGYFDEDEMEDIIDFYLDNQNYKDASVAVAFALQLHPDSVSIKARHVSLLISNGQIRQAEALNESLLMIEPDNLDALLCKGELLIIAQRPREAKSLFKQLMHSDDVLIVDMALDIAYIYISYQMFKEARAFLVEGYTNGGRHNIDLCYELACCDEQLGLFDDAIRLYNQVLDKDPYMGDVWFNLGQIYFSQENYKEAINAYDYAFLTGKNDFQALLNMAHCYFQCGEFEKAIETYTSYSNLSGNTAHVLVFVGECYEQMGNKDMASTFYERATVADPDNSDAWAGLAFCRMEQNRYDDALPLIQKALHLNPNVGSYWIYQGEIFENLNMLNEALDAYFHAKAFFPESADIYASIGEVYVYIGDFNKALAYLCKANQMDSEIEELPLLLAIAYYKLGQKDKASENLVISISKNDDNRQAFFEICPEAASDPKFMYFNK